MNTLLMLIAIVIAWVAQLIICRHLMLVRQQQREEAQLERLIDSLGEGLYKCREWVESTKDLKEAR